MRLQVIEYRFEPGTSMKLVENHLALAAVAAEGIYGLKRVQREAGFLVDKKRFACVVDTTTHVGKTLDKVFACILNRSIGEDAYRVCRLSEEKRNSRTRRRRERRQRFGQ